MFEGPSSKQSMFEKTAPLQTSKKSQGDKRRLNLLVVLLSILALPFTVIFEVTKQYSGKK